MRLISVLGLLLALVGVGMLRLPGPTRWLLAGLGIRWPQTEHARIAAWLLAVLGVVIAVVARLVT